MRQTHCRRLFLPASHPIRSSDVIATAPSTKGVSSRQTIEALVDDLHQGPISGEAKRLLAEVAAGRDPATTRREDRKALTFMSS
jgi:hypothetical protein